MTKRVASILTLLLALLTAGFPALAGAESGLSQPTAAVPSAAGKTLTEDYDNGYWLYEDVAQGVRIEIHRRQDEENQVLWYEADLQCSAGSPLLFLTANQEEPGKGFFYPERLLRDNKVVFGINDDQFGHRMYNRQTQGIIVRNGVVLSEKTHKSGNRGWPTLDTAAFFPDGSMKVFSSQEHTGAEYVDMGAETVLSFGPWLLSGGEVNPMLEKNFHTREPRSAIGMIAPYHYIVLSVEGRMKLSQGVDVNWLAQRMKALGVTEGFNLDGGKTCCIVFMGKKLEYNNPQGLVKKGRSVSGMIGLGVSELVPAYTGLEK